jgi:hypothetical protein
MSARQSRTASTDAAIEIGCLRQPHISYHPIPSASIAGPSLRGPPPIFVRHHRRQIGPMAHAFRWVEFVPEWGNFQAPRLTNSGALWKGQYRKCRSSSGIGGAHPFIAPSSSPAHEMPARLVMPPCAPGSGVGEAGRHMLSPNRH